MEDKQPLVKSVAVFIKAVRKLMMMMMMMMLMMSDDDDEGSAAWYIVLIVNSVNISLRTS